MTPKLSIITVNLNNAVGLRRTIDSVLEQSFNDYEYIVIDGDSADGSKDVLDFYKDKFSYCVSEKDSGIYNAMNKGIAVAKGEYCLFLNSGDTLVDRDVLSKVFERGSVCADIVVGRVNVVSGETVVHRDKGLPHEDLSLFSLYLYGIPHQATFIRTTLFDGCPYDEKYAINADWKFFCQKIILDNVPVEVVPVTIANYDNSGISSVNISRLRDEREKAIRELIPQRVLSDYQKVFPNYYEVYRIEWLLKHKFFYRVYRAFTSFGMRLLK